MNSLNRWLWLRKPNAQIIPQPASPMLGDQRGSISDVRRGHCLYSTQYKPLEYLLRLGFEEM